MPVDIKYDRDSGWTTYEVQGPVVPSIIIQPPRRGWILHVEVSGRSDAAATSVNVSTFLNADSIAPLDYHFQRFGGNNGTAGGITTEANGNGCVQVSAGNSVAREFGWAKFELPLFNMTDRSKKVFGFGTREVAANNQMIAIATLVQLAATGSVFDRVGDLQISPDVGNWVDGTIVRYRVE